MSPSPVEVLLADDNPADAELIVLDIELSNVSGLGVLEEIKRDPRTRAIPTVLLTPDGLACKIREVLDAGPPVPARL
jgi:CheY-like chemotaxis protein